ncbi:MAG: Hpt domain-containing protein [Planctomycetota bacterium]|nr:Hpt domain-containing protein [Planctomycetota bacterium]
MRQAVGNGFDLSEALARTDGDLELLQEMGQRFLQELDDLLDDMRWAISGANSAALSVAAGDLRGSASTFGAHAAAAAALRLEQMGESGVFDGADRVLAELESSLARLRPALESLADS